MPVTFALALTLCLALPPADQQPTVKETVVVTATAAPESLQNIGRTVVVLTGDELRQLPVVSIADALRLVGSVDVRSRGPIDVQSDISIRGGAFGQTLVLDRRCAHQRRPVGPSQQLISPLHARRHRARRGPARRRLIAARRRRPRLAP